MYSLGATRPGCAVETGRDKIKIFASHVSDVEGPGFHAVGLDSRAQLNGTRDGRIPLGC
jgi:hypothetical protein